jgi:glycosyltransferase involved in cell wall biosynthesis
LSDTTVLIPFLRGGREDWLREAINSFPQGTPYLVCENDGELAEAINEGLAQVKTEFVLPFGADDVARNGLIENLESLAWNVDVVYPSMVLVDEELKPKGWHAADPFCGNRLLTWNYVTGASLIRTSKLREVGGWRHLDTLEDWDVHVRLFRAGARFKPAPEFSFLYRQVPGSRNRQVDGFETRAEMKAHYRKLIVGEPPTTLATFYQQATPGTAYWRCQVPSRALPGRSTSELWMRDTEDGTVDFEDHEGAAVFQFPGSKDRALAILNLNAAGVRTLVETDDNYLDTRDSAIRGRAGWVLEIGKGPHSVQGHRWCVENASGVIVTTEELAKLYRELNPNVYVCPNSIDTDDWDPAWGKPDDGVFRIGWFASMSHDRDERLIRRALSWASRQPDVEIVTMGYQPPWEFRRKVIPWSNDIGVYHRMMCQLDVGVSPVVRTGWAVCRSDLKALEYAMAGALPLLSAEPPYDPWRDKPALFAHSEKDFEQQVKWCVKNRDEVRAMAAEAKAYVMGERLIGHKVGLWREAVAG